MKRFSLLLALAALALVSIWLLRAPEEVGAIAETPAAPSAVAAAESPLILALSDPEHEALRVALEGRESAPSALPEPEASTPAEWEPRITITGTLVDQNWAPVADYDVWLAPAESVEVRALHFAREASATAHTDATGRFAFTGVTPGIWWIGPALNRKRGVPDTLAGLPVAVEVTEISVDVDVLVRAHRGLTVAGKVLDPDGRTVEGALVTATGVGGLAWAITDANGVFEVAPLVAGACRVTATPGMTSFAPSKVLEVEAGRRDLVLAMRPSGTPSDFGSLRGYVHDPSGALASGKVVLSRSDGVLESTIFAKGTFLFAPLLPGTYSIAVTTVDRAAVAKDVVVRDGVSQAEVSLELDIAARIRVRVPEGKSLRRVRAIFDGVIVAEETEPGTETTLVVPAGRITVSLFPPSVSREVDTRAGEEIELVFE